VVQKLRDNARSIVRHVRFFWNGGSVADPVQSMLDIDSADRAVISEVRPFTMTSPERIAALCEATRYVEKAELPGAIVECGVWRGGSMMAVAKTLLAFGRCERELFLFDTFEGMTAPGARDVSVSGEAATALLRKRSKSEDDPFWCYAPLDAVRAAVLSTGYPQDKIHFIKGPVEQTLPAQAPSQIVLLRLDTDWYESTHHELTHLYPRLVVGGPLIIDDYGHWQGARKAVDDYIAANKLNLLLSRIDYTGRLAVKIKD
jgi:hypothetical protein